MEFWQVKIKYLTNNPEEEYDTIEELEETFYKDIEQAMAYVLYEKESLNVIDVSIKKCSTNTFKVEYTLNKKGE